MRIRIGLTPRPSFGEITCVVQIRGASVWRDGSEHQCHLSVEETAKEAHRLCSEALSGSDDTLFNEYAAPGLVFDLFVPLATARLAVGDFRDASTVLEDRFSMWQKRPGLFRAAKSATHRLLLRAETIRNDLPAHRKAAPPAEWVFLWGHRHQNQSLELFRRECHDSGDRALDVDASVTMGRRVRISDVPETHLPTRFPLWNRRRIGLSEGIRRSTRLGEAVQSWARKSMGLDLDRGFIARSILYDVLLGDALEGVLEIAGKIALVCPMVQSIGYIAARRAGRRCVEFVHGSVEEGLCQSRGAEVRELVGATASEVEWLNARTHQRFSPLHESDLATESARLKRDLSPAMRDRILYLPRYSAGVIDPTLVLEEDQIVAEMIRSTSDKRWAVKPHPADKLRSRFNWARGLANAEIIPARENALSLIPQFGAVVHAGSSLSRAISQLAIPQVEVCLKRSMLSTPAPNGLSLVANAKEGLEALRTSMATDLTPPDRGLPRSISLRAKILQKNAGQ